MIEKHHMPVSELLAGMVKDPSQLVDIAPSAITMDSRSVIEGGLFLATAKDRVQRQTHIEQAIASGASVIVIDKASPLLNEIDVTLITLSTLDSRISEIASRFYRHPSLALTIIAVTGTNGKTSVSQFIAQSLAYLQQPCGVIGTLGVGTLDELTSTGMTTPDPVSIQAALADFYHRGIKTVVIEASSHALQQDRLAHIAIDIAVLTNLSRDHLDYHRTMTEYAAAKRRLFEFNSVKTKVINGQDAFGQQLLQNAANDAAITTLSYGMQTQADIKASDCLASNDGLAFTLHQGQQSADIKSSLLGEFNIANLLATAASLSALDYPFEQISEAIMQCHAVEGRMQHYGGGKKTTVVIDFAHTSDALMQVLKTLRNHITEPAKLWCVFGCGGDRDQGKRPLMGQVVEQYADRVIITADNPRSEKNEEIVAAILSGMTQPELAQINHDRAEAIQFAIQHAKQQDIVLVAGKGHEDYQDINGVKHAFSDKTVVLEALQASNDAGLAQEVTR